VPNRPRFFVGFGFNPQSELNQLYQEVNAELFEHCGIPPLSQTHTPHLTVFPPPQSRTLDTIEKVASRLISLAPALKPLSLSVDGWDWFDGKTSTLYLKVVPSKAFDTVVARLTKKMVGLLAPNDSYRPHISFARWVTSEQRTCAATYLASRPSIPFAELALDDLSIFTKQEGGYRARTSVLLPRLRSGQVPSA